MGLARYEREEYQVIDAEKGSAALLAALQEHHDFNMRRPTSWKPRAPKPHIEAKPRSVRLVTPKMQEIKEAVSRHFDISLRDMDSVSRSAPIVHARQVAVFLSRRICKRSFPEIARHFGYWDHTTARHGVFKIARLVQEDWTVAFDVAHIEETLS